MGTAGLRTASRLALAVFLNTRTTTTAPPPSVRVGRAIQDTQISSERLQRRPFVHWALALSAMQLPMRLLPSTWLCSAGIINQTPVHPRVLIMEQKASCLGLGALSPPSAQDCWWAGDLEAATTSRKSGHLSSGGGCCDTQHQTPGSRDEGACCRKRVSSEI
jgi:hypothetical protein